MKLAGNFMNAPFDKKSTLESRENSRRNHLKSHEFTSRDANVEISFPSEADFDRIVTQHSFVAIFKGEER